MFEDDEDQVDPMVRPPIDASSAVDVRLRARGVDLDFEIIEMVTASMINWLEESKEGLDFMSYLQRMDVEPAESDMDFFITDIRGFPLEKIPSDQIEFRKSVIVRGEPMSQKQLVSRLRDKHECSSCGQTLPCVDRAIGLCSNCAGYDELGMDEVSDIKCDRCTINTCSWHPSRKVTTNLFYENLNNAF